MTVEQPLPVEKSLHIYCPKCAEKQNRTGTDLDQAQHCQPRRGKLRWLYRNIKILPLDCMFGELNINTSMAKEILSQNDIIRTIFVENQCTLVGNATRMIELRKDNMSHPNFSSRGEITSNGCSPGSSSQQSGHRSTWKRSAV